MRIVTPALTPYTQAEFMFSIAALLFALATTAQAGPIRLSVVQEGGESASLVQSPDCPSFIDQRFCKGLTGEVKMFSRSSGQLFNTDPRQSHTCTYPNDKFGIANVAKTEKESETTFGPLDVTPKCNHCYSNAEGNWGSATFCYVDKTTIHVVNVQYDTNREGYKNCHGYAIPPKGGDYDNSERPKYATFSTTATNECYWNRGAGFTGKRAPTSSGACCSATKPQRVCYASGNGMCPDAGSTTKCENPSTPGPWSCTWADGPETVWAQNRRFALVKSGTPSLVSEGSNKSTMLGAFVAKLAALGNKLQVQSTQWLQVAKAGCCTNPLSSCCTTCVSKCVTAGYNPRSCAEKCARQHLVDSRAFT